MIFEPAAAKTFIISRIQSIENADGWPIEDTEVEKTTYILVEMVSPGQSDDVHGLTDGERVLADPLFLVCVIGSDEDASVSLAIEIDTNLQGASGDVTYGHVKQVTRQTTVFKAENSATKIGKRYTSGAYYRCIVISR